MEKAFITPIQLWNNIPSLGQDTKVGNGVQTDKNLFKGIFDNAIKDVKDAENNLQQQQYLLATGQLDDPHTLQIAISEAQLSTNMLVQLRNKAMDAYNELMRINL